MDTLEQLMRQYAPRPEQEDPRIAAIESWMQRDLQRRMNRGESLSGQDAMNYGNRSNPPEYKGVPQDPDDIFGY